LWFVTVATVPRNAALRSPEAAAQWLEFQADQTVQNENRHLSLVPFCDRSVMFTTLLGVGTRRYASCLERFVGGWWGWGSDAVPQVDHPW